MDDTFVYAVCLVLLVVGLFFGYVFFLDYDPSLYVISEDNDEVFIQGSVLQSFYNPETNFTYVQVMACEEVDSFYEGPVDTNVGDRVEITGSVYQGNINVKTIK